MGQRDAQRKARSAMTSLELAPYVGTVESRTQSWSALSLEERKRRAARACLERDSITLWQLTESYLYLFGPKGARVSPHTLRTHKTSLEHLLHYSQEHGLSLLKASSEDGARYARDLERTFKPSSVGVRLAGGRLLYKALAWAGLEVGHPLLDVRPAPDPTAKWDKRRPYREDELGKLLSLEQPLITRLVLLGAHAGLRVSESLALEWADVNFSSETLTVQKGKGGKVRTVPLGGTLLRALEVGKAEGRPLELSTFTVRLRLISACESAKTEYLGYHALRHAAGTRMYRETGSLETVARFLGHSSLETARVYAKWSDEGLRSRLKGW